MTLLFNVTDAISEASNHGITRTERKIAHGLAGRDDVQFVVMVEGRLWGIDRDEVLAHVERADPARTPVVERLGIDPPARTGRPLGRSLAAAKSLMMRGRPTVSVPAALTALRPKHDDVLVSVGLDWVHGLLGPAEQMAFGHGVRYVGFCYDLIPLDHPEWLFPPNTEMFVQHFRRMTRLASSVLCISASTRDDFVRLFPDYDAERVRVVQLGADSAVSGGPEEDAFAGGLFDGEPYAVYCATIDRRKNHQLLYRVAKEMARAGRPGNFVLVGKVGNGVSDLIDCLRHDPDVAGRFVHVADCDDAHLAAIYRRARFAVYPSLYEGWGLGVTEALIHGTPCLVASGSSLGEAGLGVCRELHPLATAAWTAASIEYFDEPPPVPPMRIATWQDAVADLVDLVAI